MITGSFASGKTRLIRSISEVEVMVRDDLADVSLDFGQITIDQNLKLYLFGTPGARRFDFALGTYGNLVDRRLPGVIVMVNCARPVSFREARSIIATFEAYLPWPYVIAANYQDHPDAWSPEDLRLGLKIPEDVPVIPCIATERESAKQVLLAFLYHIQDLIETA